MRNEIEEAYSSALAFTGKHYENFPVASVFIKKELRRHVAVVYWFARTADDLADEGTAPPELRLAQLDSFEKQFELAMQGEFVTPLHKALYLTVQQYRLNPSLFTALLSAFRQDVTKTRYDSFAELLEYCSRSANPVGRIILGLHGITGQHAQALSDEICTALQLVNFYQDTAVDLLKGRIYIPSDELEMFKVSESDFSAQAPTENMRALYRFQAQRAMQMFQRGAGLLKYLSGRLKWEIRWTIAGGMKILYHLEKKNFDTLTRRVSLSKLDFLTILVLSLFTTRAGNSSGNIEKK